MTSTLLHITNKIDPNTLAVLQSTVDAAQRLGIPLFVIGATGRDLVLHHYYGAKLSRATQDLDFAIQIPDWSVFEALKAELLQIGFSETRTSHRLNTVQGGWIDLVPFGPISSDGKAVAWPTKGDVLMNILGFNEAYKNALQVRINNSPVTDIPVVSPVGLALLKLVSWTERKREKRPNDAKDLLYLCSNYQEIPDTKDEIFGMEDIMEEYDWVLEQGSAFLLGRDVRAIAAPETDTYLQPLFNDQIANLPLRELVRESCENSTQYDEHEARLNAFIDGYRSQ
ncbi:MAG: nucleotidyl transferase AbiEii/AbiGii toxin family protein [Candidatus Thiodiazotropha sp.]|jgi:predicted nucleotidyltransferase